MTATATRISHRRPPAADTEPIPSPPTRRRAPEVMAGVLVVLVCAFGALWWQTSSTHRREVLAIRHPIERGHTITVNDLQVVAIDTDDPLAVLAERDAASLIGQVARTDLAAGTLVTKEQFSAGSLINTGQGVVGLSLEAGQFPSLAIAAGDVVAVVLTPAASDPRGFDVNAAPTVLVARAAVIEVDEVGVQGRMFIAVQVTEADAAKVASAAASNRVRLIQVAER